MNMALKYYYGYFNMFKTDNALKIFHDDYICSKRTRLQQPNIFLQKTSSNKYITRTWLNCVQAFLSHREMCP